MGPVRNNVAQTGLRAPDRFSRADHSATQTASVDQRGSSALAAVTDSPRKKLEAKLTVIDRLDKFGQAAIRHIKASKLVWHITDWTLTAKAQPFQTHDMVVRQKLAISKELADSTKEPIGNFLEVWEQRFDQPKLYAKFLKFAALDQPEIGHFLRELDTFRLFPTIGAAEKILNDCFLRPKLDPEGKPVDRNGKWLLNFPSDESQTTHTKAIRAAIDTAKAQPSRENFKALKEALCKLEKYFVGSISKNSYLGSAVMNAQQSIHKT